jgi:uncharacterized protein (TIGR03437 family)
MSARYANPCIAIVLLAIAFSHVAWADQSGNAILAPNTFLNLDTGVMSAIAGDILWSGAALLPQGRAGLYNAGRYGSRAFKSIPVRYAASASYSAAPIPASVLVVGDVFGVHTNNGHYAKVLVTAANGSLSLQYTTFIPAGIASPAAATGPEPVIYQAQNNYSFLLPGMPNYGIAPGSIFVITGINLSTAFTPVLQSSAAPGLPKSLNQTSVSVTVNGTTTTPALYYASSDAVAGVLPSTTPIGTGTVTVTVNGQASAPAPIQVVPSALGLDTLYGAGVGAGVVEDINFNVLGFTKSAMPGQTVILWGSGVGADTSNDDRTYPQTENNLTNIPMQVYVGGISATILYRGRSQYPGLDQIDITIPANVSPGCYVSVVAQTGSVVSNAVTVPISPNGGPCSDPALGLSGTQLESLAARGSPVNGLAAAVSQSTDLGGTKTAAGVFAVSADGSLVGSGNYYASQGSCSVLQPGLTIPLQAALDAGTIQLTGPAGSVNLAAKGGGEYGAQLPTGSLTPGTYTLTGSGGANVGSFKVSINVQTPFTLTNTGALATIARAQGATVTWSGGFANGDVQVNGVGPFGPNGSVNFYCHAPSSAGQLTIPPSILLAVPPGGGNLFVLNSTAPQTVSASGVDLGLALGGVSFEVPATFK